MKLISDTIVPTPSNPKFVSVCLTFAESNAVVRVHVSNALWVLDRKAAMKFARKQARQMLDAMPPAKPHIYNPG